MKTVYYVKRNDEKHHGSIIEIPASHLQETLRLHKTWQVDEDRDVKVSPLENEVPKQPMFHCPLCGLESKSEHGLKVHKARKHG